MTERDDERDLIAAFLEAEADYWHKAYEATGNKQQANLAWRNHAAYSTAAHKVRHNRHRAASEAQG